MRLFSQWTPLNPRGQIQSTALRTHAKWATGQTFVCFAAHFWFHFIGIGIKFGMGMQTWVGFGFGSAGVSYHYRAVLKFKFRTIIVLGAEWREWGSKRGFVPKLFALRALI